MEITNGFAVTTRMKVHELLNSWHYFHKPELVQFLKSLPSTVKTTSAEIWFQLRLGVLLVLLRWVTAAIANLTHPRITS